MRMPRAIAIGDISPIRLMSPAYPLNGGTKRYATVKTEAAARYHSQTTSRLKNVR